MRLCSYSVLKLGYVAIAFEVRLCSYSIL